MQLSVHLIYRRKKLNKTYSSKVKELSRGFFIASEGWKEAAKSSQKHTRNRIMRKKLQKNSYPIMTHTKNESKHAARVAIKELSTSIGGVHLPRLHLKESPSIEDINWSLQSTQQKKLIKRRAPASKKKRNSKLNLLGSKRNEISANANFPSLSQNRAPVKFLKIDDK